jgi:hypothetical protein
MGHGGGSGVREVEVQGTAVTGRCIMRAVTEFCQGNFRDDATLVVVALQ